MKRLHKLLFALLLGTPFIFQSCAKPKPCSDTVTYTYFTPVYAPAATVRANIKSQSSRTIVNPGKIYIKGNYIFLNELNKGIHVINNANPAAPVNAGFIYLPGNVDIAIKGNTMYADFYTDLVVFDVTNPLNVEVKKIVDDIFPQRYYYGYNVNENMVITDWIKKTETFNRSCDQDSMMIFNGGGVLMNTADVGFNGGNAATSSPVGIAGSLARFALIDNYLYTVSEDSMHVINIANAYNPNVANSVNLGWGTETIFPFKDKLFIGSQSGMHIYGLQNPALPERLGTFQHVRTCDPVIADGNFAYVTLFSGNECQGFTNQLDVLNITDINNPVLIKTYPLSSPRGLSKEGNLLFICDNTDGLKIFNAENANSINLIKTFSVNKPADVIAHNNIALVMAADGIYQYDYSNAANIRLVSKIPVYN